MAFRSVLARALVLLLATLQHRVQATPERRVGALAVQRPAALRKVLGGYFADFSGDVPSAGQELETWSPSGVEGCEPFVAPSPAEDGRLIAAVLRRGNCTFAKKALHAQAGGASGVIIVWDSDSVQSMQGSNESNESVENISIFVVNIPKKAGDAILKWGAARNRSDAVVFSVSSYHPPAWDLCEVVIVIFATALVAAGAFVSTADLRPGSPLAPKKEEVLELSQEMAIGFCILGSTMLMAMFYFMRYMIYYVIFSFCMSGVACIFTFGSLCLAYVFPYLQRVKVHVEAPPLGAGSVSLAEILAAILSVASMAGWVVMRNTEHGWLFQDVIGASVLCMMQRSMRLPSIRTATLLLSLMFFYDIFWVFVSPIFFQKSVMVEVAKGGATGEAMPVVFRFPAISDPLGSERFLGFGDIVLPGLLVSYLLRHDTITGKKGICDGYFAPALMGYAAGLAATMVALVLMRMSQPALLYLVPGTLGTTLVLGAWRGQLRSLWDGAPHRD